MDPQDAARRRHIVAAHAAGQNVTAIQEHFGLPRAEVERILTEAGAQPFSPASTGDTPQGPLPANY